MSLIRCIDSAHMDTSIRTVAGGNVWNESALFPDRNPSERTAFSLKNYLAAGEGAAPVAASGGRLLAAETGNSSAPT